jgi:hypothetical protein
MDVSGILDHPLSRVMMAVANPRSAESTAARFSKTPAGLAAPDTICGLEFRSQSKEKVVCRKNTELSSCYRHQIVKPNGSDRRCDSCESDEMERHVCSIAGPL